MKTTLVIFDYSGYRLPIDVHVINTASITLDFPFKV